VPLNYLHNVCVAIYKTRMKETPVFMIGAAASRCRVIS
jgi:hypothetical protein